MTELDTSFAKEHFQKVLEVYGPFEQTDVSEPLWTPQPKKSTLSELSLQLEEKIKNLGELLQERIDRAEPVLGKTRQATKRLSVGKEPLEESTPTKQQKIEIFSEIERDFVNKTDNLTKVDDHFIRKLTSQDYHNNKYAKRTQNFKRKFEKQQEAELPGAFHYHNWINANENDYYNHYFQPTKKTLIKHEVDMKKTEMRKHFKEVVEPELMTKYLEKKMVSGMKRLYSDDPRDRQASGKSSASGTSLGSDGTAASSTSDSSGDRTPMLTYATLNESTSFDICGKSILSWRAPTRKNRVGKIKTFGNRGFGFLTCYDDDEMYYFHHSAVDKAFLTQNKKNFKLQTDQYVIFDTFKNANPLHDHNEAVNLRPYGDSNVFLEC